MKMVKWSVASLVALSFLLCLYTWKLSQPIFNTTLNVKELATAIEIAPIDQALTFARLQSGDVLLVLSADIDGVSAIDLGAISRRTFSDSVDAYYQLGSARIRQLATDRQQQAQTFTWAQLGIPVNETYPHIAAGTNYREHADEVGHVGDPFVFPKFSNITGWNAQVSPGTRLDYEVELCAVTLTDHTTASPAPLGYILCGDYTDRWLLVKDMDLGRPMGPTGFAAGKGGATRFPVGSLLAIPESVEFYKDIELKLYLNGNLRQRSSAGQMIWAPHKVLDKALTDCKLPYFNAGEQTVVTPSCEKISARTLLLTGTPSGVMFNISTLWNPLSYLRQGDQVVSSGTHLGFMRNTIGISRK